MANIFKTTLKKDVVADIANNNAKEIRFPITKFWATRLTDSYDLAKKVFEFRTFDSLEVSSPSNKDTEGETFILDHVKTFVDGDEFVVEFKMDCDEVENVLNDEEQTDEMVEKITISEYVFEEDETLVDDVVETIDSVEVEKEEVVECTSTTEIKDVFARLNEVFNDEKVIENYYADDNVFATNARQIIVLRNGRVLGFKKTLPVNNDAEVRIEFDMTKKIYFDTISDVDAFVESIIRTLVEIRENNFVFIWRRYTGIFKDKDGRVYFGMKYSTRKSIGFNRRYNVQ